MNYNKGDQVEVNFFGKWLAGRVVEVYPNYGFHDSSEKKYEIHGIMGNKYTTIVSNRLMRPVNETN